MTDVAEIAEAVDAGAPLRAAGIMHIVDGKVLLVLRSPAGDHGGEWAFPGGKIEDGETPAEAAIRECEEELQVTPQGELVEHLRRIKDGVDFTTFLQRGEEQFEPQLNEEHTGYLWATPSQIPEPLHPGCRVAIEKLAWNELDTARAIVDGDIVSPVRYMNVWLFDMRITGTGAAFRDKKGEFTWRDPGLYLNEDFVARCNGLAVIYEHPEQTDRLNSDEYADRNIGSIMLPYIQGEDVKGIAKIYDDAAAAEMRARQMSTSPCVIVPKSDDTNTLPLEGGHVLLIEGQPVLLDHLAVCDQGVWDKGESPSGVSFTGDIDVADKEDMKTEEAKDDNADVRIAGSGGEAAAQGEAKKIEEAGAEGTKLEAMFGEMKSMMDTMSSRMDAFEGKGAAKSDSDDKDDDDKDEKKKPFESKDDSDDEDEGDKKDEKKKDDDKDEAKSDSAAVRRLEADNAAMKRQLETIARNMPKHLSDADYTSLADAQARADRVLSAFGDAASRPLQGENLGGYRRRLAAGLQKHSTTWGKVDLVALPDSAFDIAEEAIYADSMTAAMNPVDIEPGVLRQITKIDPDTNVRTHTFVGKGTFIGGMHTHGRVAKLNRPGDLH